MPPNERVLSTEETLNALREKAKESDEFICKVFRRAHAGVGPMLMASLSGATVQHFINPELWIPSLLGGGKLLLQGYHPSDLGKPVGGFAQFDITEAPKDVNPGALNRQDWRGPAVLDFPKKETRQPQDDLPFSIYSPPAPGSGDSATSPHQAWVRQAGGGSIERPQYLNGDGAGGRLAALEAERRRNEDERLSNAKERHRDELGAIQKAHEADMRALKLEMMAALQSQKASGPDPTSTLMMEMMKQQAEDRRAAAVQAAEDRRAQLAAQERADARFLLMIEKMSTPKVEKDPLDTFKTIAEIIGSKKNNDGIVEAQTKMMHSMSDMMSQQVGVAMDFVSAAADLQLGQQGEKEPGWVKGLESVVKGIGAFAKGAQVNKMAPQQLPPQPPPYEQQALGPPPAQPRAPRPPAPPVPVPPAIDQFETAIKWGNTPSQLPVEQIAQSLLENLKDPSIMNAMAEVGWDFEALVQKRLGAWAAENPGNAQYLVALIAAVKKQFVAAGMMEGDDAPQAQQPAQGEEDAEYEEEGEPEEDTE